MSGMTATPIPAPPVIEDVAVAPFTVVRTPADAWSSERAEVFVNWDGGHSSRVSIDGPRDGSMGRERPATVNWSAIGSVSPAEAVLYATAILMAAQIAPTLACATGPEE